jgi:hypothetical protein
MADGGVDVTVTGAEQLQALALKLRAAGQVQLRKELTAGVRAASAPVVPALRTAVLAVDSKVTGVVSASSGEAARAQHAGGRRIERKKSHGLRATIARAINLKLTISGRSVSVRVRVNAAALPEDQQRLPKHLDDPKGWRHPVFGHRAVWVTQTGRPWWDVTTARLAPGIRTEIQAAVDRVAAKIEE